ncbi:MAG: MFS transporter [Nannocystaceae bacterium]
MLFRFSLYGFLKNQRYFEPFLVLAFLDRGLDFTQIGLLVAVRELSLNLCEIPSGAIADTYGRRRCMIASFVAYIASFATLGFGSNFLHFAAAMLLYGVGDAFRTGTHKAMILDWLRSEGREQEGTRVYGYTRSWSKAGSAVSSLIAAAFVFHTGRYSDIFLFSIIPYAGNLVNLATYPAHLDADTRKKANSAEVYRRALSVAKHVIREPKLRFVIIESMTFEGVYAAVKDYLAPVLVALAVALPLATGLEGAHRTALVVGAVYFSLHILSSVASRNAHRAESRWGGAEPATHNLWLAVCLLFTLLLPLLYWKIHALAAGGFILLAVIQNLWRPILVARLDRHSDPKSGATVMSCEAQARSAATMALAPLLGALVDGLHTGAPNGAPSYWPVAALGWGTAATMLIVRRRSRRRAAIRSSE